MLDTFAPVYRPEDVYASNLAGSLECLNAGITTLVDWSHINNTPEHPDAGVQGLQETGIRAQYAYGSANTSLADYWFDSAIAIPGDDVRRVRETYFSSDDGLLTMGLATRGPGFCQDEVVRAEWALARELGIPITVHVAMGRLAGRFGMVKQLDGSGLLGAGHHLRPLLLLQRRGVAAGRRQRRHDLDRRPGRDADGSRLAAGAARHRSIGLRPSLSIDVVTTVPGDMFTQMRAAFGSERARVNASCWRAERAGPRDMLTAARDARRSPPSTAPTSPAWRTAPAR